MKFPLWIRILFAAAIVSIVFVIAVPVRVCTDRAYVCEYTGSRYGYREWFFAYKSHRWSQTSPLEQFIQEKYPAELKHEWTSYAGTGRSLFGMKVSFGHGRPGPISLFSRLFLSEFCRLASDAQKKELYDTLVRADENEVRAALEKAQELVFGQLPDAPIDAPTNAP